MLDCFKKVNHSPKYMGLVSQYIYVEIQPTRHAGLDKPAPYLIRGHPEDSSKTFDPGFRLGFHRDDAPE